MENTILRPIHLSEIQKDINGFTDTFIYLSTLVNYVDKQNSPYWIKTWDFIIYKMNKFQLITEETERVYFSNILNKTMHEIEMFLENDFPFLRFGLGEPLLFAIMSKRITELELKFIKDCKVFERIKNGI